MGSEPRTKWMFTDARSAARDVNTEWRLRVRAVSGRRVPTNGLPVVSEMDTDEGCQLISLTGLMELEQCIRTWGCPVTISPPEGDALPWMIEIEDGLRPDSPLLAGLPR